MVSATSEDVARRAGVSIATVSRVINNFPHVSPAIRRRVSRAVAELKYQPNRTAQRLRAKRSRVIGLIISDIQNPFFTSVVRGIEDVAYQHGYSIVLCNSDEDPQKEKLYIDVMRAEAAAGVVIASTTESYSPVTDLLSHNIPVVAVDRRIRNPQIDSVLVQNVEGAFQAVSHLIQRGHRRIGYVGLPLTRTPGKERLEGYRRALQKFNLPMPRRLFRIGNAKQESGYQCARDLLQKDPSITALFVANNLMTLGALAAIRDRGFQIPEDISVVGFDDMPWAPLLQPPLTAVAQPIYELGQKAAELLLERLHSRDQPAAHIKLKPTLIIRGSTGPPRMTTGATKKHVGK